MGSRGVTDEHPSFGKAIINRVSQSAPGASLFDSEIRHQHYVVLTITHADRTRDLNRDWIHSKDVVTEVHMSEAQWASLVSAFGNGDGVSVTLAQTEHLGRIDPPPYEPRMAHTITETRGAAKRMFDAAWAALEDVEAKPTKANLRKLRQIMENAAPNVAYAARTLAEHTEGVVTKARADVEAMVAAASQRHGLDLEAGSHTAALALGAAPTEGDTDA
jgi:hypothetical protein